MLQGQFALLLRIFLYALAAVIAVLPFASFEQATGIMTIDLSGASKFIVAAIWATVGGGTFAWSRLIKGVGGIT